jgi:SAM-dependent methyltransferase
VVRLPAHNRWLIKLTFDDLSAVLYGLSPLVKAASCVYNGYPDEIEAHPPSQGCAEEPYGHRRKRPRLDNLQNDSESTSEVDNSALLGEDATIHDDDSGFGMSNRSSSLTSVDSSLLEHILLKAGSYMLPNDKQEDRRLDLQHDLFTKILDGQPCVTKLEDASFILDIGTGNGRWAGDIAWKYPAARVIGIDQFPVLQRWLPQNLTFFVDDINESIPFENVDFIHVRTLAGSIQDWPKFLQQCHESLNPGGKIEISEIQLKFGCEDVTYHNDSATLQWSKELHKRYEEVGSMLDIIPKVQPWLEEVGFETVKTSHQFLPTGPWSDDAVQKERGEMARELQHHSFEAYGLAVYTREGQWSTEEYQILIAMARREVCVMPLHTNV